MSVQAKLYPEIEPYNTGFLKVSNIHTVYFEECGNPNGKPVVFLHGGPGGGILPSYRQYFNPEKWRIILFDQRGSGKSTPNAELKENTTWHLVADMEQIRTHLGIEKWSVFGGSWGSTLALAYAEAHPTKVTSMVLRGIFTLRREELLWFYQKGASYIYPDAFENYLKPIPVEERDDLISAFYKRLTSDDKQIQMEAAKAWSIWEGLTSKLLPDEEPSSRFGEEDFALAFARIECHYFINKGFFETDDQLIANVHKIRHIPCVIVQGRYDIPCPMFTAWELHKAWPEAKFIVVADAGHSVSEPGIMSELVKATDGFLWDKKMNDFKVTMTLSEVNNILNAIAMGSNSANHMLNKQVFHGFSDGLLENFLQNSEYDLSLETGLAFIKDTPVGSLVDYYMIKETQFRFTQHLVRQGYSEKQFYKWLLEEELTEVQKNKIKKCLKTIEMKIEVIFEALELCRQHMEYAVKALVNFSRQNIQEKQPVNYN